MLRQRKILLFLCAGIAITASLAIAKPNLNFAYKESVFPLKRVSFQGDWRFISAEMLNDRLQESFTNNFVELSLREVQESLEALAWVKTASVRRIWPDQIHVDVEERKPLARWGKTGFVDMDVDLIDIEKNEILEALPLFTGPDGAVKDVVTMYRQFSEDLSPSGLKVRSIDVDERRSWKVVLNDGVILQLGTDNIESRFSQVAAIYRSMEKVKESIEIIDLRYSNGFAVKLTDQPKSTGKVKKSGLL